MTLQENYNEHKNRYNALVAELEWASPAKDGVLYRSQRYIDMVKDSIDRERYELEIILKAMDEANEQIPNKPNIAKSKMSRDLEIIKSIISELDALSEFSVVAIKTRTLFQQECWRLSKKLGNYDKNKNS